MTRDEIRRMLPLQAGALLGPMTGAGVITLVPTLADLYGASVGTAGLAVTAYMAPFALLQLFSGSVAHRLGGRRTALLGFAVFGVASLACATAPTLPLLLLFRLLQGVGAAFLFPILMALVGEAVAPERLGRAIGAFGASQTLGLTLGPVVAGLAEAHLDWRAFFVLLALGALAAALGFVRLFEGEPRAARGEGGVLELAVAVLREPALVLLALAAAGLFFAMIGTYTYIAAWLEAGPGLAPDQVGLVLGVAGAVGIPASAVAGRWVDRFGRKAVGTLGLAGYVVALLGLAAAPYSFGGMLGLAAAIGWTGGVAWTALNTLAVEVLPARRKPAASVYNAVRFVGYSLGPPVLGLAYGRWSLTGVCVASAVVVALAGCLLGALAEPRGGSRTRRAGQA